MRILGFPNYVPSNDLSSQMNCLNYIKISVRMTEDYGCLAAPDSGKGLSSYPDKTADLKILILSTLVLLTSSAQDCDY
jgi:hypothetical protein